jgi:hypothetical protein
VRGEVEWSGVALEMMFLSVLIDNGKMSTKRYVSSRTQFS